MKQFIHIWFYFLTVPMLFSYCSPVAKNTTLQKKNVLVFSKTLGYHHASIPAAIKAIQLLAAKNGMEVDTTTDASRFNTSNLKKYSSVLFLSTSGDVLSEEQQEVFKQ